jgi:transcriptional regulator with XRE-family HTH domain
MTMTSTPWYTEQSRMKRKARKEPSTPFGVALARLLKERGLDQTAAAELIGYGQSSISAAILGTRRPTRDFVEAVITAFGVDGEEWRRLAFSDAADERRMIAREAAEEALRRFTEFRPLEYLGECFNRMVAHYGEPFKWEWQGVSATDTKEHIDSLVQRAERQLRANSASARKKAPLFITEP